MKGFSGLCQEGQCPHSDENMLGNRNKEELLEKQVSRKALDRAQMGVWEWRVGENGKKSKYIHRRRLGRKVLYPPFFSQNLLRCIPGRGTLSFCLELLTKIPNVRCGKGNITLGEQFANGKMQLVEYQVCTPETEEAAFYKVISHT